MMPTNDDPRPDGADRLPPDDSPGAEALPKRPRMLSQVEFAELVNRKPRTVRDWVRSGLLTPHRVGRRAFYLESDVFKTFGNGTVESDKSHLDV